MQDTKKSIPIIQEKNSDKRNIMKIMNKKIKIILCLFLFIWGYTQDSNAIKKVQEEYKKYYNTYIQSISSNGTFIIQNHANEYGKNEDFLYNTHTKEYTSIPKGSDYHFIKEDYLLIEINGGVLCKNLKTSENKTYSGFILKKIDTKRELFILYAPKEKMLQCLSLKGNVIWQKKNVLLMDTSQKQFVLFMEGDKLIKKDILNATEFASPALMEKVVWAKIYGNDVWIYAQVEKGKGALLQLNDKLQKVKETRWSLPEGYILASRPQTGLEIREQRYLMLPLIREKTNKSNPHGVQISYTLRNESFPVTQLGIYDTVLQDWSWQPRLKKGFEVSYFMNDKGDFVVYNPSEDIIENQGNLLVNMTLIRNYGKEQYSLGKMYSNRSNYYWDDETETFIYFKERKWWRKKLGEKEEYELMEGYSDIWNEPKYNGLTEAPIQPILKTNDPSKIIISGAFDLYLMDLKTLKINQLTNGQKDNIQYEVISELRDNNSFWEIKSRGVDIKKGVHLRMFNTRNYHSGLALLAPNLKLKTIIYGQYNFFRFIKTEDEVYGLSQGYEKPLEVYKLKFKNSPKVFQSSSFSNPNAFKIDLFTYSTPYKTSNAVLLYPKDFNPSVKYPMIVKVYEDTSKSILSPSVADLRSGDGFNVHHYVRQGYFVLLPQLQYATQQVAERYILSLEASVKTALTRASIDKDKLAVIGMSFGGYEAALAMSNTSLFKTGSIGVMISDLITFGFSYNNMLPNPNYERVENGQNSMLKSPFEDWENYVKQSPLYHIPKINQPILLWGGMDDKNVLPFQTKAYFSGLKRIGKEAVLLEYPNEGHYLKQPQNNDDLSIRTWQWMEHYLKGKEAAEWMKSK